GVVPLSRTLDHVGPLTQTVSDACLVYHALLGDERVTPPAPMPLHGLRLAVPRRYFCDLLEDEVRARFESALDRLRAGGAHFDDIEIHHAADIAPVYLHIVLGDAAAYHATSGDLNTVWPHVRWNAVRGPARRLPDADRRPAEGRPHLRTTCVI